MGKYTIRQIGEYLLRYSQDGRVLDIEIDWRDPVPALSFDQVSIWKPPHDQESISRDQRLQILNRIVAWIKPKGYDKVYVAGHGYLEAK